MKHTRFAVILGAVALTGCGSPALSDYTTSRDTLFYLQQTKPRIVSVGEFTDASNFRWNEMRFDFGCAPPEISEGSSGRAPSTYVKNALVEELMVSGSYSATPTEPQLRGELTHLSLARRPIFGAAWSIELLLTSSNDKKLLTREEYSFDFGALYGPTLCERAVENFEPAVRSLLEKAIQSPEFLILMQD